MLECHIKDLKTVKIQSFSTPTEAIKAITNNLQEYDENPYIVILTDYEMPDINGFELILALKDLFS